VDGAPTPQQLLVFEELHRRLQVELAKWQEITRADVPALNDLMRKQGVPTLTIASGKAD
jgi:hypothetical protein